jgi:hypothetical protein
MNENFRNSRLNVKFGENITSIPIWVDILNDDWIDLGAFQTDDDLLITLPNKSINESQDDFEWVRSEGKERETIVKELNNFIDELNNSFNERGDTQLELDYEKTHEGGHYFGRIWVFNKIYELLQYGDKFAFTIHKLVSDPRHPQGEEYQQVGSHENLPMNNFLTRIKSKITNDYYKGYLENLASKFMNESEEDFDWVDDFKWSIDMLYSMLENCNEIRVANYSLQTDSPYITRGEPTTYTLTRCKEWWDKFSQIPLDDNGRGPAEWYQDYDEGRIGVLASYENKNPREINIFNDNPKEMDGWTITQRPQEIVNSLNGEHQELFILLGKDGRPVYDLIPKKYREKVKTNWEDYFYGDKLNESDDFDWIRDVPEVDVYKPKVGYIYDWSGYKEAFYGGITEVPKSNKIVVKAIDGEDDLDILYFDTIPTTWGEEWDEVPLSWFIEDMKKGDARYIGQVGLKESETGFEWANNPDIPLRPYPGEEYIWKGFGKGKKSFKERKPISDHIIVTQVDEPPLHGVRFRSVDDKYTRTITNIYIWDRLVRRGDIVPVKGLGITESKGDWDWAKEIPGTKEYGQRYRYFEILACYGIDWETEECDDVYSHFIRIPIEEVDEIWNIPDVDFDYLAGPGDEGEGVIMYAVRNGLISANDLNEIVMYEGVREIGYNEYIDRMGKPDERINEENDFDWIRKQEPERVMKKSKKYIIDVRHLKARPMKFSHDTTLTKQDILDKLYDLDYNVDHIPVEEAGYFYVEPTEDNYPVGYWDDHDNWVNQTHWVDWTSDETENPNFGGRYEWIDVAEFMFLIDNNLISESKKPINEVAGISFEARKWAEIIYDEIISNPEEKTRLIIDGYDYPEAFNGFPIDYVVVDFYDRLTGYGQEHSGYDKDGNYVVLLYVQPKLVSGQGGYSLQSALNHEMKHAWEDYNRLSKGLPSIEQTKESQELYNRDYILMLSDQNVRGPIKEILKYYYYLSNLEKSAYLENVYDQNPTYEKIVREIAGMDFGRFKDRFDLDVNWHLMNTAYDIPFLKKFKSPREFIDYSAEELRSRALKMIKKINKMKYVHGKM